MRGLGIRLAAAGAVGALLVAARVLERVEVDGRSMLPALQPGDRLVVLRRPRRIRVGDLVVVSDPRDPGRPLVKRVHAADLGHLVLRGDNAGASTDSRTWGPVPRSAVQGRVLRRYASAPADPPGR